jgi:hypothetical protein
MGERRAATILTAVNKPTLHGCMFCLLGLSGLQAMATGCDRMYVCLCLLRCVLITLFQCPRSRSRLAFLVHSLRWITGRLPEIHSMGHTV